MRLDHRTSRVTPICRWRTWASAEDDHGIERVAFTVDGSEIGSAYVGRYTTAWDSATAINGSYSIAAVA